jgi:YidC/Oxa1 family membrane protein insertase
VDKRFVLFLVIMLAALSLNALVVAWLNPPAPPAKVPPQPVADAEVEPADDGDQPAEDEGDEEEGAADAAEDAAADEPAAEEAAPAAEQWLALGSLDPASPYRMLVVLSSAGAAVDEIVLNGDFADLNHDWPSGYLGPLAAADAAGGGAEVRLVVPGTPAAAIGLRPGDVVTGLGGKPVENAAHLEELLRSMSPEQTVELSARRSGQPLASLTVTLARRPVHVVHRERNRLGGWDPPSLLLTLAQQDDRRLGRNDEQLEGVPLRSAAWELTASDERSAEFRFRLPKLGLVVWKRFRLAADAPGESRADRLSNYHLDVDVEIENVDRRRKPHRVAYRLDGPTGLPIEGWWYASKVHPTAWFSALGTRDVAKWYFEGVPDLVSCTHIADDEFLENLADETPTPLIYMGVDAQYFAAVLVPQKQEDSDAWHADSRPIRAGAVSDEKVLHKLLNTSCRLTSRTEDLEAGDSLRHTYRLFAGPKKPELLAQYRLDGLVQYGLFSGVSRILLSVLHFFHSLVGNYGIAIVMLTMLVRTCMLPISLKQTLGAQKMQELQPEIKRINEKFKGNLEQKNRAMQELFRKHKYNPLGGCLLVFLQLPIFMGLYRALMVDVELRQSPLIPGLAWCSNLAAPDKVLRWNWWGDPTAFLVGETGYLGPYLNLLPLVTVGLYLWQQTLFMPPATDEQTAMQQKMMKWMTVLMGFMFFKVAAGLCIYFIASSLWSVAERKLLPKLVQARSGGGSSADSARPAAPRGDGSNGNGAPRDDRKKQRER